MEEFYFEQVRFASSIDLSMKITSQKKAEEQVWDGNVVFGTTSIRVRRMGSRKHLSRRVYEAGRTGLRNYS